MSILIIIGFFITYHSLILLSYTLDDIIPYAVVLMSILIISGFYITFHSLILLSYALRTPAFSKFKTTIPGSLLCAIRLPALGSVPPMRKFVMSLVFIGGSPIPPSWGLVSY